MGGHAGDDDQVLLWKVPEGGAQIVSDAGSETAASSIVGSDDLTVPPAFTTKRIDNRSYTFAAGYSEPLEGSGEGIGM